MGRVGSDRTVGMGAAGTTVMPLLLSVETDRGALVGAAAVSAVGTTTCDTVAAVGWATGALSAAGAAVGRGEGTALPAAPSPRGMGEGGCSG